MAYSEYLRAQFPGIEPDVQDLLFLESFQIGYLPGRLDERDFRVLLRTNPVIRRYFYGACPSVRSFIDGLAEDTNEIPEVETGKITENLLWEIADLIIYSRYPEIYDSSVDFVWKIEEIIPPGELKGKTVIDAGAGPGKLSFQAAPYARTVFALEPVKSFRSFIKNKADNNHIENIYPLDGFLDSIPLPDNSADYLLTSQAIGWNLQAELQEIERVLKPDGSVYHLFRGVEPGDEPVKHIHTALTSPEWNYQFARYPDERGVKLKYFRKLKYHP